MTAIDNAETAVRDGYIEGLRMLADLLEAKSDLPLPYDGSKNSPLLTMILHGDNRTELAAAVRALPCRLEKVADGDHFKLRGQLSGLHVQLLTYRKDICERVVTGTRQVEVTEPDPAAVAALPKVTRTETVEDVEWICPPSLLAPAKEAV